MKTATDSDGKRPPVPIQNGHFRRGSDLASCSSPLGDPLMSFSFYAVNGVGVDIFGDGLS